MSRAELRKGFAMKTFRNTKWTKRDYECTNVVACVAEKALGEHWVECDESILAKLSPLWIQNYVQYYGYM